jgi:small subunit ribosomal protein S2
VLDGISAEMAASGRDIGAAEELPSAVVPPPAADEVTEEVVEA